LTTYPPPFPSTHHLAYPSRHLLHLDRPRLADFLVIPVKILECRKPDINFVGIFR
jgi:hypothetical protein